MSNIYYSTLPPIKDYFRPKFVKSATSLLTRYGKEASVIAGGTDLLVSMRSRKKRPAYLIDITGIKNLKYIKNSNKDNLKIGALTTIREIEMSELIRKKYTALYEAAHSMGTIQINNVATVGGNICRGSPSADMACPLCAFKSKVKLVDTKKSRVVPLESFSNGSDKTILAGDEILTEIQIPNLLPNTGSAFLRATRTAVDLAKVNVAVVISIENGICTYISIVLGSVAPTLMRAYAAEEVLRGKKITKNLIEKSAKAASDAAHPRIGSLRASPEYKKLLANVLTREAVSLAIQRAQGKGVKE